MFKTPQIVQMPGMQEPGGKCLVRRSLALRYQASVVSRLALRWAAQQPQTQAMQCAWRNAALLLGPLRSPTQGKPAHHKGVVVHTAGVRVQLVDVQHVQNSSNRANAWRAGAWWQVPGVQLPGAQEPGAQVPGFCGEQACPALGCAAALKPDNAVCLA
jgi:hypothetical protein